jgi:hypothetical protein
MKYESGVWSRIMPVLLISQWQSKVLGTSGPCSNSNGGPVANNSGMTLHFFLLAKLTESESNSATLLASLVCY